MSCVPREEPAACYHPDATFEDIAFPLRGKKQIHGMWHMIAETDLVGGRGSDLGNVLIQ